MYVQKVNRYYNAVKDLLISCDFYRPNKEFRSIASTVLFMVHRGKQNKEIQLELRDKHDLGLKYGKGQIYNTKTLMINVIREIHKQKMAS